MPLKKASGNMYEWITHMHTHLGGECPHKCKYCYIGMNRFGRHQRYKGPIKLLENEINVRYGTGKSIFIEHMNDMFSAGVEDWMIEAILNHCNQYRQNKYIIQTRNTLRAFEFRKLFPRGTTIGTTIESNRMYPTLTNAPSPNLRLEGMNKFRDTRIKTFVTIEPILDFDIPIFSHWLIFLDPDFINIGADSKSCGLPEPSKEKVLEFILTLDRAGVTIKEKNNLQRIYNVSSPTSVT